MTQKERMLKGLLYKSKNDKELWLEHKRALILTRKYNNILETIESDEYLKERTAILKDLFGSCGEDVYIEPEFHCDYGSNIYIGNHFYANFGCVMLDVARIDIGNNVMIAPHVLICTAGHPIDAEIRISYIEYGKPIKIGDNVWIGAGSVINPGVTIGNNTVIGSGSTVTKNIPDNVVAAGSPARIIREITDKDKAYWQNLAEEYERDIK